MSGWRANEDNMRLEFLYRGSVVFSMELPDLDEYLDNRRGLDTGPNLIQ